MTTLEAYTEWMKGLLTILQDGTAEVRSFAVDEARNNVAAYGVFRGTHTGEGGPVPPTGKSAEADYVYVMDFDGDKIRHMTKIWNDGLTTPARLGTVISAARQKLSHIAKSAKAGEAAA
jgi:predicted ester cyclase